LSKGDGGMLMGSGIGRGSSGDFNPESITQSCMAVKHRTLYWIYRAQLQTETSDMESKHRTAVYSVTDDARIIQTPFQTPV